MLRRVVVAVFFGVLSFATALAMDSSFMPAAASGVGGEPVVINQPCTQANALDEARDVSASTSLKRSVQCVAGMGRSTRGNFRDPSCITEPRALQPGAVYLIGQCKGYKTEQGEAIAQERAIARLNADGVYGDSGSLGAITPNLQWETKVAYVPTPTGRVDLLTYDRSNPAGPVSIVEMKGTWDGGADRAAQEVTDYVNANHGLFGARDVEPYDFNASPFPIDTFSIDRCASADPHINNYTTHTEPGTPGVLVVDRTRASCASQNQPVPSPHVNLNGIDVYIGVDNNGNGNDDLFDSLVSWAQAHGLSNLVSMLPSASLVTFARPLEVHLSTHQVRMLVYGLTALAASVRPDQAGTKFLQAVEAAATGDSGGLGTLLGAGGSPGGNATALRFLDQESVNARFAQIFANEPDLEPSLAAVLRERDTGQVVSATTRDIAARGEAELAADATGTDVALLERPAAAAVDTEAAGGSVTDAVAAARAAGASDSIAEVFTSLASATVTEEGAVLAVSPIAGAGIVLLLGALAFGVFWAHTHPNIWGDPHLATLDGLAYDMQTVGEFHLLKVPSQGIDVQGRYAPSGNSTTVSSLSRIAFALDDTRVELTSDGQAFIDGDPWNTDSDYRYFGDGTVLYRNGSGFAVRFAGADPVTMTYSGMNLAFQVPAGVPTAGLLGNHDGLPGNDLATADGTTLTDTSAASIDGAYADSWRVTDSDSLFWYQPGQTTADFTDRAFPSNVVTLGDFDSADLNAAAQTCTSQGVQQGPQFQACLLDVAETGDAAFAKSAAAVTDNLTTPDALSVDGSGSLTEDYEGAIPVNLAPTSTFQINGSTAAGPIFDASGYSFYVPALPHHTDASVSFDLDAVGLTTANADNQQVAIAVGSLPAVKIAVNPESATVTSGPASIVPLGATSTGAQAQRYRVTVQGEDLSSQLRVVMTPTGFRGVLGTSLAVDNLSIAMSVVPPQEFNITAGQPITPGSVGDGSGQIETKASHDLYHFHVADGDIGDYLVWQTCPPGLSWQLLADPAVPIASGSCSDFELRSLKAGDYTIDVSSDPTKPVPATYGFTLQPIPADASATLQLDDTPVTLSTVAPGQNGVVTFDGTAGQRVQLQASGATMDAGWTVLRPDGSQWASFGSPWSSVNSLIDTTTLTQTGTYTIQVDPRGAATGAMTFKAWTVPDDLDAGAITVDGPSATVTTVKGQNATLTFQATAGQRVQLQASGATMDAGWTVLRPDGSQWASFGSPWSSVNSLIDTTTLTQTGTYTINLDPRGTEAGSVTFKAWSVPADLDAGTMSIDGPSVTVTTVTGQNAALRFQGTAGQRVLLQASGATMDAGWSVLRPDGSQWASFGSPWSSVNSLIDTTTLAQTGTYTINIDPRGTASGAVTFRAWSIPATDLDAGTLAIDGPPLTITIPTAGENGWISFQGTAGQRIQLQGSGSTMDTAWQVIRPDGSQWAAFGSPWSSANSLIDTTTLPQTGTYVIKVDPNGTATGSLTFKAWTVPVDLDAGTLQVDSATGVKVTTLPGQNATLSFHGTSGQRAQLQASGATMDAGWAVYRPDGSQWASFGSPWSSVNSLIDTTTLTQTGTYVINIDPRGTASGSVTFKAWTVPADLDLPLTLDGTAVTAAIASPGQNSTLHFQASAGQRIQVQGSGATMDAAWSLTNPDGSAIASFGPPWTSTNSTVGATTLTQTGTYTVTLDPAGTTTGSVTFKAWALLPDLDLGALPTDGSTTNASNVSGQNLTASFTGTQGKSVVLTLANQAGGTVDWKVLDPDGQQVFSATGNASWSGTLTKTGTYVLKLNPRAPDRTTFTLGVSVTDAPPPLGDRLNSGQKLTAGQQLTSPNAGYSLRMQSDGNLVVYGSNNNAIWSSGTWNNPGAYAVLQPDGNLVVYRSNNSAAWATGTNGQPVDRAVIQDDGSLVLYTASGSRVWSSR